MALFKTVSGSLSRRQVLADVSSNSFRKLPLVPSSGVIYLDRALAGVGSDFVVPYDTNVQVYESHRNLF